MDIEERGPWAAYKAEDGRIGVASDDFTHDAILWVYGDFADDDQRMAYAEEIANTPCSAGRAESGTARCSHAYKWPEDIELCVRNIQVCVRCGALRDVGAEEYLEDDALGML